MNQLIILLCTILVLGSCGETNRSKKVIDAFINTTILGKDQTTMEITDFIKLNPNLSEEDRIKMEELSYAMALEIRNKIENCGHPYKILTYQEISNEPLISYAFEYSEMNSVYYVVCDNKVLAPIIIEKEKIVSFYTKLKKTNEESFKPFMLN